MKKLLILISLMAPLNATDTHKLLTSDAAETERKLKADYEHTLSLEKQSHSKFDLILKAHSNGLRIIALFKIHVDFFGILEPNKKTLSDDDKKFIASYAHCNKLNQQEQRVIAEYLESLLKHQSPKNNIRSPQQSIKTIPHECLPIQEKLMCIFGNKALDKLIAGYKDEIDNEKESSL